MESTLARRWTVIYSQLCYFEDICSWRLGNPKASKSTMSILLRPTLTVFLIYGNPWASVRMTRARSKSRGKRLVAASASLAWAQSGILTLLMDSHLRRCLTAYSTMFLDFGIEPFSWEFGRNLCYRQEALLYGREAFKGTLRILSAVGADDLFVICTPRKQILATRNRPPLGKLHSLTKKRHQSEYLIAIQNTTISTLAKMTILIGGDNNKWIICFSPAMNSWIGGT